MKKARDWKGGSPMLDDFHQEKPEQAVDPLLEAAPLPWSKKVALLCIAIGLIGLFIFFTSGSWSSGNDEKTILSQLEEIESRLAVLEQNVAQPHQLIANPILHQEIPAPKITETKTEPSTISLKEIIEQDLQNVTSSIADHIPEVKKEKRPAGEQKKSPPPRFYTVQQGDSLSKISQKVYGTSKKWRKILAANRDKIGRGQVVRVGTKLVIPEDHA